MGKVVRCPECGKAYRDPEELEELRDNDSVCLVCNAPIEVSDWDRVLASWEESEDTAAGTNDGDDDDDWSDDEGEFEDVDDAMDDEFEPDFDDEDEGDDDEDGDGEEY